MPSLFPYSLITDFNRISKIQSFPFTSNSYFPEALCLEGHAVAQVVEALRYKPEGREVDSKGVTGIIR